MFCMYHNKLNNKNNLIMKGSKVGNLYELIFNFNQNTSFENSSYSNTIDLWHRRLGHLNFKTLEKLPDVVDDIGINNEKNNEICEVCIRSKQAVLPFSGTRVRATRPLQLIHSDVCGPIEPQTWENKRYYVSFIDNYTHFTVVYLLLKKNEFFNAFKQYEASVTASFGQIISRIRCDNGRGEYDKNDFKRFCIQKGIELEYTVPYTPQQNCVAERMNRTIMEKARALIFDSGINKEFWGESVYTAVYLINRCPTRALEDRTPAEIWKSQPILSNIRLFGCKAFLQIPMQLRKKLDSKTVQCVTGYRLWHPLKRTIVLGSKSNF